MGGGSRSKTDKHLGDAKGEATFDKQLCMSKNRNFELMTDINTEKFTHTTTQVEFRKCF